MSNSVSKESHLYLPLQANLENTYEYMGLLLSFLLPAASTAGRLSIIRGVARAGTEPPPHIHLNEHETYLVKEGTVEFFLEGDSNRILAEPGDLVFLPYERAHALKYHTEKVEMLMFLEAVEGKRVQTEQFFRDTARGRATSTELATSMSRYVDLDEGTLSEVAAMAKEAGILFLAKDELQERLPLFVPSSPHETKAD